MFYICFMNTIETLLCAFERQLLPQERVIIARGPVLQGWTESEFPPGIGAVYQMNAVIENRRMMAHRALPRCFGAIAGEAIEPEVLGRLISWAMVEFSLNSFSSFASFVLLLRALGGDRALPFAAQLYAAAITAPGRFTPALLDEVSLSDMALLHAALDEPLPALNTPVPMDQPWLKGAAALRRQGYAAAYA